MSYTVISTPAIIIATYDYREAERQYLFFTKQLGLIWAQAMGVRLLKSKLRFALQTGSHTIISVVRGKRGWRITNAVAIRNHLSLLSSNLQAKEVFFESMQYIRRLTPLEEPNEFFKCYIGACELLSSETDNVLPRSWLQLVLARLLFVLGYLETQKTQCEELITSHDFDERMFALLERDKKELTRAINQALEHSHL